MGAVDADHRGAGQVGRVADQPDGLGVAAVGAGLAGEIVAADAGAGGRAPVERAAHDVVDPVGDLLRDHLLAVGVGHLELLAGLVGDALEDDRVAAQAAGRHRGVGVGQRDGGRLGRTQREGRVAADVVDRHPLPVGLEPVLDLQAQRLGHADGVADADVLQERDEVVVHRALGARVHVELTAATGVGDLPLAVLLVDLEGPGAVLERLALPVLCLRGVVGAVGRESLVDGRREGEHLVGRPAEEAGGVADLPLHRVVQVGLARVCADVRTALRQGLDQPGARLDHRHQPDDGIGRVDVLRHGLLGGALRARVDLGLDRQAAAVDGLLASRLVRPEARQGEQDRLHDGAQVLELRGRAAVRGGGDEALVERGGLGLLDLLVGDRIHEVPHLGGAGLALHDVEDVVAALDRDLLVADRVGGGRVADEAGEHGGLGEREVLGRRVEVPLGRGLHAVRTRAVVGEVEVALEDLVLAEALLQGDRVPQLQQLAGEVALVGGREGLLVVVVERLVDQRQLHVLLGERRAALGVAAGGADERAERAAEVEGAVGVEALVLHRELGLLHRRGDLRQRHVGAVLVEQLGQYGPVRHQHRRALGRGRGLDVLRDGLEGARPHLRELGADASGGHCEASHEDAPENTHEDEHQGRVQLATHGWCTHGDRVRDHPVKARAGRGRTARVRSAIGWQRHSESCTRWLP